MEIEKELIEVIRKTVFGKTTQYYAESVLRVDEVTTLARAILDRFCVQEHDYATKDNHTTVTMAGYCKHCVRKEPKPEGGKEEL